MTPALHGANTIAMLTFWRAERVSFSECGRRLDITRNAVAGLCWRNGLCAKRPPARPPAEVIAFPSGGCCWPEGDPGDPGFQFCGAPVLVDARGSHPYCERHQRRAWLPPAKRQAAEAAIERAAAFGGKRGG